jgi:hypothetical protein
MSVLGDWSAFGGATGSAVAATAAWAAARQSREQTRAASTPHLLLQVLNNAQTGCLDVAVENAGGGIASGCSIWISTPRGHAAAVIGNGFLRPGQGAHISTDIPASHERLPSREGAIVGCRDLESFRHYWSNYDRHKIYRTWRRQPVYPGPEQAFRDLHGFDPEQGPPRSSSVALTK